MLAIGIVTDNAVRATDWRGISQHLRGATIAQSGGSFRIDNLPEACAAVVFVGSQSLEKNAIEHALGEGKHVLLATEPCLSSDDLQALSDVAHSSGLRFAVVNPDRYLPSRQLIKQQLEGQLGSLGLIRVHRWESVRKGFVPFPGQLPGPLVRDLELVLWLAGELPTVVYALEQTADESYDVPPCFFQIHLGFDCGMALIDFSDHLPSGPGYQSVSAIGSSGAVYADDHQNSQLLYRGGLPQAFRAREGTRHLAAMIQEFVDAIAMHKDLSPTVTGWCNVLSVVDAVTASLEAHRAIEWKKA